MVTGQIITAGLLVMVDWCSPQSMDETKHHQETVVFVDYIEAAKRREHTNNKDGCDYFTLEMRSLAPGETSFGNFRSTVTILLYV